MGSSISVRRANEDAIFVHKNLVEAEALLKVADSLRFNFIKFIKEKKWTGSLVSFEDTTSSLMLTESTWKRFGYKSPHCSGTRSTEVKSLTIESTKGSRADQDQNSTNTRTSSYSQDSDVEERSDRDELRSILIAALLPIYLRDLERQQTIDIWTAKGEKEKIRNITFPSKSTSPGRLEKWLVKVSNLFSIEELDDYLAQSNGSWIADYKNTLANLPVRVTLCTVDAVAQSSTIVFSNAMEDRSALYGSDLHELYSEDCSPGGAVQVCNAVFNGKKYKRSLTNTDGQCRLRAMKPVFNASGKHVYTLGVESTLFEDPVLQASHGDVCEKPFQQVEDYLLVLPMLIRTLENAQ